MLRQERQLGCGVSAGAPAPEIHHREEIAAIDGPRLDGTLLLA
jgi:hypothetical protein